MNSKKQMAGFTLIELLVAVAILAVILSLAVPAMNAFLDRNRLTTYAGDVQRAIQYARNEAVGKSQSVSICASANSTGCTGSWDQGWIVFLDGNRDGAVNGTDQVLRVWPALADRFSLVGTTLVFSSAGTRVQPTGLTQFLLRDPKGIDAAAHSRTLRINNVGWVTVSKGVSP